MEGKNVPLATQQGGGEGLKALVAGPLRKKLFMRLPKGNNDNSRSILELADVAFYMPSSILL